MRWPRVTCFTVGMFVFFNADFLRADTESADFQRHLPVVEQTSDYTCGPAVILSLAQKHRTLRTPLTDLELGKKIGTNPIVGTSPQALMDGLRLLGLAGSIKSTKNPRDFLDSLNKNKDYILLIWLDSDAHWVGLSSKNGGSTLLMDPYQNRGSLTKVSLKELIRRWKAVRFDQTHIYDYLSIEVQ